MPVHQPTRPVPPAHGGEITDRVLDDVIVAASAMAEGRPTAEQFALVMLTAGPLAEEVQQWRRRMSVIAGMCTDNVILMPGR